MSRGLDLATAGATWVRLAVGPPPAGAPWTAARALEALRSCGARLRGRPDVLGAGRGEPLLARHDLEWGGIPLHLECRRHREGDGEVALEAPPWDELVEAVDTEAFWDLVDTLAAAVDAVGGGLGDEDAVIAVPAVGIRARRLAVELRLSGDTLDEGWTLPRSGLVVAVPR